jgi:hypothetical protein
MKPAINMNCNVLTDQLLPSRGGRGLEGLEAGLLGDV